MSKFVNSLKQETGLNYSKDDLKKIVWELIGDGSINVTPIAMPSFFAVEMRIDLNNKPSNVEIHHSSLSLSPSDRAIQSPNITPKSIKVKKNKTPFYQQFISIAAKAQTDESKIVSLDTNHPVPFEIKSDVIYEVMNCKKAALSLFPVSSTSTTPFKDFTWRECTAKAKSGYCAGVHQCSKCDYVCHNQTKKRVCPNHGASSIAKVECTSRIVQVSIKALNEELVCFLGPHSHSFPTQWHISPKGTTYGQK